MKAYIAISFSNYKLLAKEVMVIKTSLAEVNITPWIFVEKYYFEKDQEKEMMTQAFHDISQCQLLIAESSEKAIGVGIEAGYAKGLGKKVIYIRHTDAEHSTTLSGLSDDRIYYSSHKDLSLKLKALLSGPLLS